tara:strand:- start:763 stop:1023 length:261 start_codon:yes stop_codon:yes gene_type:complete
MEMNEIKYDILVSDLFLTPKGHSISNEFYLNLIGQERPLINGKHKDFRNVVTNELCNYLGINLRVFNFEYWKWLEKHKLAKIEYND